MSFGGVIRRHRLTEAESGQEAADASDRTVEIDGRPRPCRTCAKAGGSIVGYGLSQDASG